MNNISYLGVINDLHLNWKAQIVILELYPNLGTLLNINILVSRFYSFLIFGLVTQGDTYHSTINPLLVLRKKAIRAITLVSDYHEHTNPIYIKLQIPKIHDLVYFNNAIFMYYYYSGNLPSTFDSFIFKVNQL